MMENQIQGRIEFSGTIEYRDKDGNVIKTVPFNGTAPLKDKDDGNSSERVQESGS